MKLDDFIKSGGADQAVKAKAEGSDIWGNLGASGYSALNSVLMGLPDFLVKNIGGDKSKAALDQFNAEHQGAADAGNVLGTVGSLFLPGGAIAKGAGKAIEAIGGIGRGAQALNDANIVQKAGQGLQKAGAFLHGADAAEKAAPIMQQIGKGVLRGAGQAAEQGVVRDSLSGDFSDLPQQLAFGGAAGSAAPILSKALGKFGNAIKGGADKFGNTTADYLAKSGENAEDIANLLTLDRAGIKPMAVRKLVGVNRSGTGGNLTAGITADPKIAELADQVREAGLDKGLGKELRFENHIQGVSDDWNKLFENAGGIRMADHLDDLKADPNMAAIMAAAPDKAEPILNELVGEIDSIPNPADKRKYLQKIIDSGQETGTTDSLRSSRIAQELRDGFDDLAMAQSGKTPEEVASMKQKYGNAKLLGGALALSKADMAAAQVGKGSDTMAKIAAGGILGNLVAPANQDNPEDQTGKILSTLGGAALGSMANKAAAKLATIGKGQLLSKVIGPAFNLAAKVSDKVASSPTLSKIAGGIGDAVANPNIGGAVDSALAAKKSDAQMTAANNQPSTPTEASVQAKEGSATAAQVADVKKSFLQNPKFASIIKDRLASGYQTYYSDMDPNEFMQKVTAKTNGFTDMPAISKILYPEDQKAQDAFLRKYDAYLTLKNIDIDKAIKGQGGGIPALLGINKDAADARDVLTNTLMNLQTEGDVSKRNASQTKILTDYINKVRDNPALLPQFMKDYGLDFKDLQDLGLVGGPA